MTENTVGTPTPEHREIVEAVCAELEKHNTTGIQLHEDTDVTGELAIDSVAVMDLMFELEERFDIAVPLNQLGSVRTIGQIADLVRSQAKSGGQQTE
ncbi:acyl carrier protein [Rhodovibrio salinarum]|uniref:Carrier domain-containing protein n=1 Tax=Rhodovibrio salinarum TaxID=1087 RepID=A0A934QMG4_9PROT|nr:acyl carrier protein [Rhodovibrio salinarum]MBK1699229.1 hypothetical protein [Rhodovibrio salinarum]